MIGRAKSATSSTPWAVVLLSLPAGVAIWSGWVGIGTMCGFGLVQPLPGLVDGLVIDTRITLPIGMETYAAVALRAWLTSPPGVKVTFAKWSALAALSVGAAGQIAYHLMEAAGITAAPWPVVAAVATLPVAVLGMGAALAHLSHHSEAPEGSTATPSPGSDAEPLDTLDTLDTNAFPQVSGGDFCPTGLDTNARSADTNTPRPRNRPQTRPVHGDANALAQLVRELTEAHPEWTQAQVAAQAGCSVRTVRRHQSTQSPVTPALASTHVPAATELTTELTTETREDDAA